MAAPPLDHCAIDFGTSNSAVALAGRGDGPPPADGKADPTSVRLVPLEGGQPTMPTAVFYCAEGAEHDGPPRSFGRAAIASYVQGVDGRLMRSMKSILGSTLAEQRTDVGGGRAVAYLDVVAGYLKHLLQAAERSAGAPITRAVIGRPVRFVDDDDERDAQAQAALEAAARRIGLRDIQFQYEPIAAALDHERRCHSEQTVLVADIGGGTSDFCIVRVGPQRAQRLDRSDDILAHHGLHVAGTDFDRHVALATVLRECGHGAMGPAEPGGPPPREVPSRVYHDLATWHLINTVYAPQRVAELRAMRSFYGNPAHHRRLMTVVNDRLGHELAAAAEGAKIALSQLPPQGVAHIDMGLVEPGLATELGTAGCAQALDGDIQRIVGAARETLRQSGLPAERIDALYFTGGSTGLKSLVQHIAQAFPQAQLVHGDPFASVAKGLGVYSALWFAQ